LKNGPQSGAPLFFISAGDATRLDDGPALGILRTLCANAENDYEVLRKTGVLI